MNAVNIEIRDSSLHISGYVNAVGRDSRVINTRDGRCVEQIEAGAFAASLADGHEVRMKLNHKRDIGSTADGTLTLKEDNIGLYAEAVTEDEELRTLAAENKLTGWSFGFVKKDGIMEERGRDIPKRRIIKALDLSEVSILSVTPAYCGTSVECRAETETRSYNDYEEENTAAPEDEEKRRYREAVRGKVQCFLMREKIKKMKGMGKAYEVRAFLAEAKEMTREYEERYNHYHDPSNGQFASGKGGGMGLYYSMGKGKGEVVGASSEWNAPKKSLDKNIINRVNSRNSLFYDAGSAIERKYNSEYDEIGKLNLTVAEKATARQKIYEYSSNELDARQHFVGVDVAGPARSVGNKSDTAYKKAERISGEHSAYMDNLRKKSLENSRKESETKLFNALTDATKNGHTEITINGKSYYRSNKKSMTWHEGTKKPKSQKQLSFF